MPARADATPSRTGFIFRRTFLNVARSAATVGEALEQGKEAVNIAVCLLLYSVAVLVFAPRPLHVLTRAGHAPRFGVAVWLSRSALCCWPG